MKNLAKYFCMGLAFILILNACDTGSSDPTTPSNPTTTGNPTTPANPKVYTVIGTDVSGDSKIQTGPSTFIDGLDGTEIAYLYDDSLDVLHFRVKVVDMASFSSSPSIDFNFLLPNGTDGNDPTGNPFTGTLATHRTANIYTDDGGAPPASYTYNNSADYAVNGITLTSDVQTSTSGDDLNNICSDCIELEVDTVNNWIICSIDRTDIISDTEIGPTNSALLRISSGVGFKRRGNDNVVDDVQFSIHLRDTSSVPNNLASLTTTVASSITDSSAISGGNVSNQGSSPVTARGICFDTAVSPTIIKNIVASGSDTGIFVSTITGLHSNTKYYARAYATNGAGTAYGNEINFTTVSAGSIPTLTSNTVSAITDSSAISGGNITNQGSSNVSSRGVCYSTSNNPTITDNVINSGNGNGNFVSTMNNLTKNTNYFVRAFATNSAGTAYGNELSFTTLGSISFPTVTTNAISSIMNRSAITGGNVTSDGNATVTERGIVYGPNPNPSFTDNFIQSGNGTGSFSITIPNLTENKKYYVRAYARNSKGIAFGAELDFTTTNVTQLATVSTDSINSITDVSGTSGGNITYDGNSAVVQRGIVYSTNPLPTVSDNFVLSGSGDGTYSSMMVGLQPNTKYYVRAFATNTVGTAYGNEVSFESYGPPTVLTIAARTTGATSGEVDINVTKDPGGTIIASGVVYNLAPNPTITNSSVNLGAVTGTHTVVMNPLLQKFTYYVRAFARNSYGITYGAQVEVNTFFPGQSHQGGKIAYVDASGKHGIIVALSDQSTFMRWDNLNIPLVHINASGVAIGTGLANSNAIVTSQGQSANYAAKACLDLVTGGYSDWYLPSKDELNQIFLNAALLPGIANNSGYWSSSEFNVSEAWIQNLTNGTQSKVVKTNSNHVRAIRNF